MRREILFYLGLGLLLWGCGADRHALVVPKNNASISDTTTSSGANLRPYLNGPDLRIYKVVSRPDPLVPPHDSRFTLRPITVYEENIGNAIAYASEFKPSKIIYFQRVAKIAAFGQPITYELRLINVTTLRTTNLLPGERVAHKLMLYLPYVDLYGSSAPYPVNPVLELVCMVDASNRTIETDENNNESGPWSIQYICAFSHSICGVY